MNRTYNTALNVGLAILFSSAAMTAGVARAQILDGGAVGDDGEFAAFTTFGSGWTSTSSGTSGIGRPATLTWSVVPDNTQLPTGLGEPVSNSNLIDFLDGIHHGGNRPGGADLTQRNWWQLMNSVFERWDEVSGITFNYEPNDDGSKLGTISGVLGTRGDHRIGGHSIDGQTSPTFLAYNFFPNNSDMVIDTDEVNRWGNATNNYRLFRNMMAHEIAHGFGLNHVEPGNRSKLMEPNLARGFDGPQFDDILGAQRLYGDANEEGSGNETYLTATMLGSIQPGQTISIGTDAVDSAVSLGETDFVSIDDNSDVDYFRFSIAGPQIVDFTLTPLGPTYQEGPNANSLSSFDASAQSDLTLALYDSNGTSLLEFSNDTGLGLNETIDDYLFSTPGDYFVRVRGINNEAQFFQLDIVSVPEPSSWLLLVLGSVVYSLSGTMRRLG